MDCTFRTPQGNFNYRVGAIIRRGDKLLVMREEEIGHWYLPGGRVKLHEPLEDALLREVAEELALPARIVRPLWLVENFYTMDTKEGKDIPFHELGLYFFGGAFHRCPPGRGNLFPKGLRWRLASVPLVLPGGPAGRVAVPLLFKGGVAPFAGEPGAAHPVGLRRFPLFFLQWGGFWSPKGSGTWFISCKVFAGERRKQLPNIDF